MTPTAANSAPNASCATARCVTSQAATGASPTAQNPAVGPSASSTKACRRQRSAQMGETSTTQTNSRCCSSHDAPDDLLSAGHWLPAPRIGHRLLSARRQEQSGEITGAVAAIARHAAQVPSPAALSRAAEPSGAVNTSRRPSVSSNATDPPRLMDDLYVATGVATAPLPPAEAAVAASGVGGRLRAAAKVITRGGARHARAGPLPARHQRPLGRPRNAQHSALSPSESVAATSSRNMFASIINTDTPRRLRCASGHSPP